VLIRVFFFSTLRAFGFGGGFCVTLGFDVQGASCLVEGGGGLSCPERHQTGMSMLQTDVSECVGAKGRPVLSQRRRSVAELMTCFFTNVFLVLFVCIWMI